jgi:hypothetical protein
VLLVIMHIILLFNHEVTVEMNILLLLFLLRCLERGIECWIGINGKAERERDRERERERDRDRHRDLRDLRDGLAWE